MTGEAVAATQPEDARVLAALRATWGYESLRPLQAEAIDAALAGRDALVVLPTGGGKSLCYQIPPLVTGKQTLVISPLIALMEDQAGGLKLNGYPAVAVHSAMEEKETDDALSAIRDGSAKLILTSPERALTRGFLRLMQEARSEGRLGAIAIDEAHCISHWGHDFRPEYRRLAELRDGLPGVPVQCFTATATPRVRDDICEQMRLNDPVRLVGSFDRPNLTYRVVRKHKPIEQIAEALGRHHGEAAIVYCISRAETERTADALGRRGINARAYHAGLSNAERSRVQSMFLRERLDVVCATVAFGMGIDRSDVRLVAHAAMPKSVEAYQQEAGRAGRDGLPSECLLLYSSADALRWRDLLKRSSDEAGSGPQQLEAQLAHLRDVSRYASSMTCRHKLLCEHFGQSVETPADGCGACDVCLGETETVEDGTTIARKILSAVARCEQGYGSAHIIDVLKGKQTDRVSARGHDQLSTFGLLADHGRAELASYIDQLTEQEVLAREGAEYPVLVLGPRGRPVLRGEEQIRLSAAAVRTRTDRAERAAGQVEARPLDADERQLFEALRSLRRSIADDRGVPPYVVFSDATLREIARNRPSTPGELLGCRGIGRKKLDEFGRAFLDCVNEFQPG